MSLKGLEDADSKAAQSSCVFRPETASNPAAIFVEVPVDDVMGAFDIPVSAIDN